MAAVLRLSAPDAIPADKPLTELGMDSLMAVQVRHELAARLEQELPAALAFDYPTIHELSRYLSGRLLPRPDAGAADADQKYQGAIHALGTIHEALRNGREHLHAEGSAVSSTWQPEAWHKRPTSLTARLPMVCGFLPGSGWLEKI